MTDDIVSIFLSWPKPYGMNEVVAAILEVIKYTVPALIVFLTVYFLMKKYHSSQYNLKVLELNKDRKDNTLPLKLQAYERLALFCERIRPDQLIYRLNSPGMKAGELRNALLISIQKEFEHNLTQQIYVSDNLWKIISLTKNELINLIGGTTTSNDDHCNKLSEEIINAYTTMKLNPIDQSLLAIKKEVELVL